MDDLFEIDTAKECQILIWLGAPSDLGIKEGFGLGENGRGFTVERIVPSTTKPGTINVEAWSDNWNGDDPTSVLIVGGSAKERAAAILAAL